MIRFAPLFLCHTTAKLIQQFPTHPLQAQGSVSGPSVGLDGSQRLGLTLETTVDRTLYGLNWNAPLPKGGFALANDVKLIVELELALEEG